MKYELSKECKKELKRKNKQRNKFIKTAEKLTKLFKKSEFFEDYELEIHLEQFHNHMSIVSKNKSEGENYPLY